jgi:hypothetical protein
LIGPKNPQHSFKLLLWRSSPVARGRPNPGAVPTSNMFASPLLWPPDFG